MRNATGAAVATVATAGAVVGAVVVGPLLLLAAPVTVAAGAGIAATGRRRARQVAGEIDRVLDSVGHGARPTRLAPELARRVVGATRAVVQRHDVERGRMTERVFERGTARSSGQGAPLRREHVASRQGAPVTARQQAGGRPVTDWATDYDVLDPGYVVDPYPVWAQLREECPVAHSDRWGGSYLPTRYADVAAVAHDVARFSSRDVGVVGARRGARGTARHRPAADRRRPARAHVGPPADPAVVLAPPCRLLRAPDAGDVRCPDRPRHRHRPGRRRPGLRPAHPGAGDLVDARRPRRAGRHVHRLGARRARVRPRPRAQRAGLERHRRLLHGGRRGAQAASGRRPRQRSAARRGRTASRCPTSTSSARWP